MNDYPGWSDDSRARYEQRRTLANDEYAQWRDGGGDDADEDDDDGGADEGDDDE